MSIDETLKRLLADVDDHMEFAGTIFKSKDMATLDVLNSLDKAKAALLKEFLDIIGPNEKTAFEPADRYKVNIRNNLKAELRTKAKEQFDGS